ncbi:MAG: site-specific integrase [Vicinamibacterales bacterium]|nr:site-specific integrase [Vicinamibacterales bacterium]
MPHIIAYWAYWSPSFVRSSARAPLRIRKIDLHCHDLRHEAGSRWHEAGVPLHHVRALLGHSNIATTDTYLNAVGVELQKSIRHYDEARTICKEFARTPQGERRPSRKSEQRTGDKSPIH